MLASVTLEVHLPAGRHSSSTKSVEHSRLGSRLEEGMPSGAANASSNANGRWRRNRKDELNDTRPNRSSQFFETQLAEGSGRRDHLNGTICPAADWQGRLACPMREPAEDRSCIGIAQTAMLVAAGLLADARTACRRQARTVQTMWACGPAHRRPVPAHEIPGHGSGQPSED